MRLPKIFKQRRMRGKSKSPEAKFKEKQAAVNSFLLDTWLKQLRTDPALAERIAEQRYGSEAGMSRNEGGEYEGGGADLLEVLRQAKEAKALLKDELGEGKGSTIRDIAEVIKALPSALQAIGQINPAQLQQFSQHSALARPKIQQIEQSPKQESGLPQLGEIKLEKIMTLLALEPEQAWEELKAQNETGWTNYLKTTTYESLSENLNAVGKANPEHAEQIQGFLKQYHHWLQDLLIIAHKSEEK